MSNRRVWTGIGIAIGTSLLITPASAARKPTNPPPATNPNLDEWALINLTSTQTTAANNGAGVKVAVLDGLADCRHTDLTGRCTNTTVPGGQYRFYDSHGTHTSGTVAGTKYGVATAATVLNYAVFDDRRYIAGGNYLINFWADARSKGARIASMSFGCTGMALCFTDAEVAAMANGGPMLYVKAAGNDTKQLATEAFNISAATALAAINRTIWVGSVDVNGVISSFSNTPGEGCMMYTGATACSADMQWKNHFIVAPGQSIYSTLPGNTYGNMSGTSMATPIVSGVAALMQAKWPTLSPEDTAQIFFQTATDKGAAGTDIVYGRGLLNVAAAFAANGTVAAQTLSGGSTPVQGSIVTNGATMSRVANILGGITVYDSFGRDYTLAEAGGLSARQSAYAVRQLLGRKQLALGAQADWADALFAPAQAPRGFAYFGSSATVSGTAPDLDQSLRMGVDMPMKSGAAQFRFTGSSDARFDFANDASLKPLALFASTGLIRNALFGNALINVGKDARLMVYSTATTGAMNGRMSESAIDRRLVEAGIKAPQLALTRTGRDQKQAGFGVGYWLRPEAGTVIGLNASVMEQKGGWYDLVANIGGFDKTTRLYNAGAAVSHVMGKWELTGSGEVTRLVTGGQALAVSMSNATLASAELTLRRNGLFARTPGKRDSLALALVLPPTPVSGKLMLDYMTRTPDGLGKQGINRSVPLSQLGFEPARVEAAYRFELGRSMTFAVAGGANLKTVDYVGKGDVVASLKLAF